MAAKQTGCHPFAGSGCQDFDLAGAIDLAPGQRYPDATSAPARRAARNLLKAHGA